MNYKELSVSINTNALGICSGTGFAIPIEKFANGKPVEINGWMPPEYQMYVKPIVITLSDDNLSIKSPYKNVTVPLDSYRPVNIKDVGLSYASCNITIYLE